MFWYFNFTQILLFTCIRYQVSENKGWIMTLLLSGVLCVCSNRDLYFMCYYKLHPAPCFLVLLWSLKERSFKTSIAVSRHPHLKIHFFHAVWYFDVSLTPKHSLFFLCYALCFDYLLCCKYNRNSWIYVCVYVCTHRSCSFQLVV